MYVPIHVAYVEDNNTKDNIQSWMRQVQTLQSCYAALPFRVCVKGQEGSASWIFSMLSPGPYWKGSRTMKFRGAAVTDLAGAEGGLGGACGTGFSHVSRRQWDPCAWVSVQRKAVVQLQASGNRETSIMGNVLGKEQQHLKKKPSPSV